MGHIYVSEAPPLSDEESKERVFLGLPYYKVLNLSIYYLICESLVLDKRRRRAEMVASAIAMLVSHDTTTKGGLP